MNPVNLDGDSLAPVDNGPADGRVGDIGLQHDFHAQHLTKIIQPFNIGQLRTQMFKLLIIEVNEVR